MDGGGVMARGYLRKRNGTWYASTYDRTGKVVLADNTNSYEIMLESVRCDVAAVNRLEGAGHRIQFSYVELVDAHPNYPKEKP